VVVVGPSGCGKSTLLRLVSPTSGAVRLEAASHARLPSIGMVFQSPVLLRWLTTLGNVLFPARLLGRPAKALFSTHGIEAAVSLADRVIVLSPRPGRIIRSEPIGAARPRTWDVLLAPEIARLVAGVRAEPAPSVRERLGVPR
jgi:ABC-type nitrate/sulfonate/bicarbonate transport system ATPase subunit